VNEVPSNGQDSVRVGANVTNFEAYLRALGSVRQIMTARSPDLSAYCSVTLSFEAQTILLQIQGSASAGKLRICR
jgi:hypothetical protein